MNRKTISCILVVILLALTCGGDKPSVRTEPAVKRNLVSEVSGPARIRPSTEVKISADAVGRVIEIAVDEGERVEKGQFLLRLDSTRYETQVQGAEAELRQAHANLEQERARLNQGKEELSRLEALIAKDLVSQEDVDRQRTSVQVMSAQVNAATRNVERAEAVLSGARDQLARTTFHSPIAGTISKVNIEEGEMAVTGTMNNPGTILLRIASMSRMEAEVEIDETEIIDVTVGQPALVELDAFPDTSLAGTVVEVSTSAEIANPGTPQEVTSFPVVVSLDESVDGIRPGMTSTVRIETAREESVLSVAIASLVVRDPERERRKEMGEDEPEIRPDKDPPDKEGVYVVIDGKTSFRPLRTGISGEHYVEITAGLEEDESVVTGPFDTLRELRAGTKVKIEETEEP